MSAPLRRAPRFRRTPSAQAEDPAVAALTSVVRRVGLSASAAMRRAVQCRVEAPEAAAFASDAGCERVWRMTKQGTEIWCAIDAAMHRRLLAIVIGGPPAERPTAVERKIAGEVIARMLVDVADAREEMRQRPSGDVWRCCLTVSAGDGPSFELAMYAARNSAPPRRLVVADPGAIPVELSATVAPERVAFADIAAARAGEVLVLGSQDRMLARLTVNDVMVAEAELGLDGAHRALRIARTHAGASV